MCPSTSTRRGPGRVDGRARGRPSSPFVGGAPRAHRGEGPHGYGPAALAGCPGEVVDGATTDVRVRRAATSLLAPPAVNPILEADLEVQSFCRGRGWRYCIIGAIAVQRYGEPRLTQDVDVTILTLGRPRSRPARPSAWRWRRRWPVSRAWSVRRSCSGRSAGWGVWSRWDGAPRGGVECNTERR